MIHETNLNFQHFWFVVYISQFGNLGAIGFGRINRVEFHRMRGPPSEGSETTSLWSSRQLEDKPMQLTLLRSVQAPLAAHSPAAQPSPPLLSFPCLAYLWNIPCRPVWPRFILLPLLMTSEQRALGLACWQAELPTEPAYFPNEVQLKAYLNRSLLLQPWRSQGLVPPLAFMAGFPVVAWASAALPLRRVIAAFTP